MKSIRKKISLIVISLSLTACLTTEQFNQNMDTWLNMEESALIQSLGIPTNSYVDAQGNKYIVYEHKKDIYNAGIAPTYTTQKIGNTYQTYTSGGVAPSKVSLTCDVTFQIINGIVSSWNSKGNNCVSPVPMNNLLKKKKEYDPYQNDPVIKSILELQKP